MAGKVLKLALLLWQLPFVKRLIVMLPLFFILILWVVLGQRACKAIWWLLKKVGRLLTRKSNNL